MSKRKKSLTPVEPLQGLAKQYFDLWVQLNLSHDELEIDDIREDMNDIWPRMNKQDKRDFHRDSDAYERKHPTRYQ